MSRFADNLQRLRDGTLVDFLCRDDFSAWVDLVALPQIELLACAVRGRKEDEFLGYSRRQVQALARRIVLSRRVELLESMRPLWIAFGSSQESCVLAASALDAAANWTGAIVDLSRGAAEKQFSASHAEFIERLRTLADQDQSGPLGAAVRSSRLFDEALHVGFPVIYNNGDQNLQPGIWVEPTFHANDVTDDLGREWERLFTTLRHTISNCRHDALPLWLHELAACDVKIETLASAGLSLVMHRLAEQRKRPLPFGVGFTGRWENDRLRGVRELGVKALAAREAGLFLLFVCPDPNEQTPTVVEGVKVVLLPEHLSADDVIRCVNRICAELGLTEYRFRAANRVLRAPSPSSAAFGRDLPDACNSESCPVGFVGRKVALSRLQTWKRQAELSSGRRILAVVGPPRTGKTTLLSHWGWAHDRTDWAFDPVWFSFRHGRSDRRSLENMGKALADQITARFGILTISGGNNPTDDSSDLSDWRERIETVAEATDARIDVVVDGIDEAWGGNEGRDIASYLQQFPGNGVVIVGTQPAFIANIDLEQLELRTNTSSAQEDALDLIEQFTNRFDGHEALRSIVSYLRQDRWRRGLVERAGSNLWILTDFLSAIESDLAAWPDRPEDVPLSDDVGTYVQNLLNAVLDGCENGDDRKFLNTFLAFLSFLGDRPWGVADVRRLAGDDLAGCDEATWSRNGLLSRNAKRLVDFNGNVVKFHSPFVRETIADNFQNYRRAVAERLVQVVRKADSSCDLLEFAVARLPTLLEEVRDPRLAHELLSDTPWVSRRFHGLAGNEMGIAPLLDELNSLLRLTKTVVGHSIEPLQELLDCMVQWQPAIETGAVAATDWWRNLAPVRAGRIPCHQSPGLSLSPETSKPTLLAPPDGYGRLAQALQLTGPGCALGVGADERLAVAGLGGRLFSFARKGEGYFLQAVINVPSGRNRTIGQTKVMQLEPLDGGLTLALIQSPDEKDFELFLVDLGAPSPQRVDETPPGLRWATVLKAEDGDTRIVVITQSSADTQEMGICQMKYGRLGTGTLRHVALERKGSTVLFSAPTTVQSPTAPTAQARYSELWPVTPVAVFASNTWAVRLSLREGASSRGTLAVYQARGDEIKDVTSPKLHETLRGYKINGVCPVPDGRLAVVIAPRTRRKAGKGVHLLLVGSNGELQMRIRLDAQSTPDAPTSTTASSDTSATTQAGEKLMAEELQPLGWHAHFGLLLGSTEQNCVYSRKLGLPFVDMLAPSYAIALEPESLLRSLVGQIAQIDIQRDHDALCGAVPLAGDRLMLVYSFSALVLGPDAMAAVPIGVDSTTKTLTVHLGGTRYAPLRIDVPFRNGRPGVRPTGVRVSASGSRPFASDGPGCPRELVDLEKEFRDVFEGIELLDVTHKYIDDDNWACGILALRPNTECSGPLAAVWNPKNMCAPLRRKDFVRNGLSLKQFFEARAKEYEKKAARHRKRAEQLSTLGRPRNDLVVVGRAQGRMAYLCIADVPYDCRCQIEALSNGLIAFRYGCVNGDRTRHPLHLYDLIADGFACPHADAELGTHDVSYKPPLLDVSPEWVLLLGSPSRKKSGEFAVYQYRVGSLERPSRIKGLRLMNRPVLVERSTGHASILELGPCWARVHRFKVGREFGILPHDVTPQIKLVGDGEVHHVDGVHVAVVHGYESQPYRVEVVRLPKRGEHPPRTLAIGYLPEEHLSMLVGSRSLEVWTPSGWTSFDLSTVPGVQDEPKGNLKAPKQT